MLSTFQESALSYKRETGCYSPAAAVDATRLSSGFEAKRRVLFKEFVSAKRGRRNIASRRPTAQSLNHHSRFASIISRLSRINDAKDVADDVSAVPGLDQDGQGREETVGMNLVWTVKHERTPDGLVSKKILEHNERRTSQPGRARASR